MNTVIKKLGIFKFAAAVIILLVIGIPKVKACHFAAADIYVTYIGAGVDGCSGTTEYKYEVTLFVYHACQSCFLDAGQNQNVFWTSQSAIDDGLPTPSGSVAVNHPSTTPDTVHQLCAQFSDS